MIVKRKFLWFAIAALGVALAAVAAIDSRSGSHFLRATVVETKADIGIPGISKMYEARVTNFGLLPVKVESCDYLDDASSHGTMVAYAVQRWDDTSQQWRTVVASTAASFCKPYPLGIVKLKSSIIGCGRADHSLAERRPQQRGMRSGAAIKRDLWSLSHHQAITRMPWLQEPLGLTNSPQGPTWTFA